MEISMEFLQKKLKIHLPQDLAKPLLAIHEKDSIPY